MRWPPVVAGVVALGVGALLLLSGDEARQERDDAPEAATTTTLPRESPHLRWLLVGGDDRTIGGTGRPRGFSLGSVYDLERAATVTRLRTTDGPGRVVLVDDADVFSRVGETLRFSAWLRVSGEAQAYLTMSVPERTMANRGEFTRNLAAATSEGEPLEPGRWERRELTLVVPEHADIVLFGIRFEGDGALSVDEVVDP